MAKKIKDIDSILLGSMEACLESIRRHHSELDKEHWDEIRSIYGRLLRIQQYAACGVPIEDK